MNKNCHTGIIGQRSDRERQSTLFRYSAYRQTTTAVTG